MNFEDDISRKTIAVVGASGYIGTSLVSRIEKSKARIIRVSRRPLSPKKNVDDWTLNICNKSSWDRIVKEADIIIHLS